MNDSNILISYEAVLSLADKIQSETTKLQSIFYEQNRNFEMINLSSIWSSNSQGACYSKYKELSNQYDEIITSLNTYSTFLRNVAIAYRDLDDKLNNAAGGGA